MPVTKPNLESFFHELTENIQKSLHDKNIETWIWREHPFVDEVKAFYGNGIVNNSVVIWITERPSSARNKYKQNKFPDWKDTGFYETIKEKGLGNMHLTDFVKIMADAGECPTKEELRVSALWMKKEIELLRTEGKKLIIIANSHRVNKWFEEYLPEYRNFVQYKRFFKPFRGETKEAWRRRIQQMLEDLFKSTI